MKKNIIFSILFIGLIGVLASCEKDETKTVISDNPTAPTITTFPGLTLKRDNGKDTLEFKGTPVNPGFTASATYYLEADTSGNNFANPVIIKSGIQNSSFKITVSDLNGLLIKKFPADKVSTLDFRMRAALVIDAGTGYTPLEYSSATKTAEVTLYGLPRLDVIVNDVVVGKVQSPLGDGKYYGYVKLNTAQAFTLKDPDKNILFGGTANSDLAVNGPAMNVEQNGWNQILVDTADLTNEVKPYRVSIVGAFTGWGGGSGDIPGDILLEYNDQFGYWYVTLDIPVTEMKFRRNGSWDWPGGGNWGPKGSLAGDNKELPANGGTFELPGTQGNFVVNTPGNYTINFINDPYLRTATVTFIKN